MKEYSSNTNDINILGVNLKRENLVQQVQREKKEKIDKQKRMRVNEYEKLRFNNSPDRFKTDFDILNDVNVKTNLINPNSLNKSDIKANAYLKTENDNTYNSGGNVLPTINIPNYKNDVTNW